MRNFKKREKDEIFKKDNYFFNVFNGAHTCRGV